MAIKWSLARILFLSIVGLTIATSIDGKTVHSRNSPNNKPSEHSHPAKSHSDSRHGRIARSAESISANPPAIAFPGPGPTGPVSDGPPSRTAATEQELNIGIIGEGVVGLSTATAILELNPKAKITIYHDKPFEEILSRGIAGLFRVDDGSDINKLYGNDTFVRLAQLWREYGGLSGVQLLSGHIVSTDKRKLDDQEGNYGNIVTNFRWLKDEELHGVNSVFGYGPNITAGIHYTAFTSEGIRYCPFMKQQLLAKGVKFVQKKLASVDDLAEEGHPIVVNCGGFNGGELAGDDAGNMIPIRGVLLKMDASWHKHFLYLDYTTITIPTIDTVYVGTVKQEGVDGPMHILPEDVEDVWRRYEPIQPALKRARQIGHFVGIRPGRRQIRVEAEDRTTKSGKKYRLVHNYGHGGNGFTLAYGSGLHAAHLALGVKTDRYDDIVPSPLPKDPVKKTWKKAEEFYKEGLNLKSG